jgi:uncharacterized membrane protein YkvI
VDQGQFSDPDFISGTHQREIVQFADKYGVIVAIEICLFGILKASLFHYNS